MILQKSPASSRPAPFRRLRRARRFCSFAPPRQRFPLARARFTQSRFGKATTLSKTPPSACKSACGGAKCARFWGRRSRPIPFRADKWIYVYRIREARSEWRASPALELFFVDDALARIRKIAAAVRASAMKNRRKKRRISSFAARAGAWGGKSPAPPPRPPPTSESPPPSSAPAARFSASISARWRARPNAARRSRLSLAPAPRARTRSSIFRWPRRRRKMSNGVSRADARWSSARRRTTSARGGFSRARAKKSPVVVGAPTQASALMRCSNWRNRRRGFCARARAAAATTSRFSKCTTAKSANSPSGTALRLGEALAAASGGDFARKAVFARPRAAAKKRRADEIGFSVMRGGDAVGEHAAVFCRRGRGFGNPPPRNRPRQLRARRVARGALCGCCRSRSLRYGACFARDAMSGSGGISNPRLSDYESAALTAKLPTRRALYIVSRLARLGAARAKAVKSALRQSRPPMRAIFFGEKRKTAKSGTILYIITIDESAVADSCECLIRRPLSVSSFLLPR